MERIADVIQKIEQDEHAHRVPLAAEPAVKAQQRESFNGPADDYKKADLSEAGVDLVNQQEIKGSVIPSNRRATVIIVPTSSIVTPKPRLAA